MGLAAGGDDILRGVGVYNTPFPVSHEAAQKSIDATFSKAYTLRSSRRSSDLHLLFLPIWYSVPNIILASTIFYLITRSALNTIAFDTGISVSLLYYEWTHYIAHRPIQPVTPWGRKMKRNHLWHHFKNENYWYGVTNPTMDLLFGTYKNEREVPRSQTAKDLEHRFPEESTHI